MSARRMVKVGEHELDNLREETNSNTNKRISFYSFLH